MAPLLDDIRKGVKTCGQSRYAVSRATGISQAHLCQFMKGTKGLSVEAAEKLADYLGLTITVRRTRRRKGR